MDKQARIDKLEQLYKKAKQRRVVLNRDEFAKKLDYSRSHIYKMQQGEFDISDEILNLAEKISNETIDVSRGGGDVNNNIKASKGIANQEAIAVHYDSFMETHYVPRSAYAGYLRGHSDPTFIDTLPTMLVPKEFDKGHYLVFEVSGNSMDDGTQRALMDGDKILAKELDSMHWKNKLYFNRNIFVIADKNDGIVVKQIIAHNVETGVITCHSWNNEYEDYQVKLKNVQKLFYVKKIVERKIHF